MPAFSGKGVNEVSFPLDEKAACLVAEIVDKSRLRGRGSGQRQTDRHIRCMTKQWSLVRDTDRQTGMEGSQRQTDTSVV